MSAARRKAAGQVHALPGGKGVPVHMPGPVRVDHVIKAHTGVLWPVIVIGDSVIEVVLSPQQIIELEAGVTKFREMEAAHEKADRAPPPVDVRRKAGE